jgi:hypothetical protein
LCSFSLGFYASELLELGGFLGLAELKQMGFLPNGFFERLLCRISSICLEDSPVQATDLLDNIRKDSVLLSYKGQRFRMASRLLENMIRVDVFGHNPIPIYLLLSETIEIVCEESFGALKYMGLLPCHNADVSKSPMEVVQRYIKLPFLEQCVG